jgi:CYTH domain-containing protein
MRQVEIERKFLISALPGGLLDQHQGERIEQGYLLLEEQTELRIRKWAGRCTMTLKHGSGLERIEQEKEIDRDLFAMLWPLTAGRRIEKTRHVIVQSGHRLEVDRFSGALAPLIMLEVEFTTVADSKDFVPPTFVGREVTQDRAYSNAMLATAGLPTQLVKNQTGNIYQSKENNEH